MFWKRLIPICLVLVLACQPVFGTTLKIATLSPEGSMWMEKMRQGAEEVEKKTEGRVKFKFYPGGVMGNDKAVLRKIRVGQLHGGAVVAGSLSSYFSANQIYSQPMKFKSLDEVDHVRQHMDDFIENGLEEAGFVTFGITGGGFAYIMSKEPIETVSDLRARKVWIPDNDQLSQEAVTAFGVTPIPLPISDVRTSLASGLIDTVGTSPVGAIVLQWHTEIKYVTNVPLVYLHAVLAVDSKYFNRIPEPDREIVKTTMTRAFREIDEQNRLDDTKAVEALKNRGITFITPKGEALAQWLETAETASVKMVESGSLPKDPARKVDQLLTAFRNKAQ